MSGEEAPGGNDYLAFSSNDRTPHQNANQFRPYKNNQWRNSSHNRGNFSPQGFSSPITGSDGFRGGNRGGGRPRFNQDNRYGNSHDGDSNSIGRNRLPRSFGNQRPYHNRRGGNGGEQKQRSFQKINFQPAGDSGSPNNISNYYHPSMTEDPWKDFNMDEVKNNISTSNPDPEQGSSDSSENPDDDSIV